MQHFYLTSAALSVAFAEWERRYREEPEQYLTVQHVPEARS